MAGMRIADYVLAHAERGECKCGRCSDVGNKPDPKGHTADLTIFKVAMIHPVDKDEFVELTYKHRGVFVDCNPFDGNEHGFIELGGWIGDQGVALMYMGLGTLIGVFELLAPETIMPWLDADMKMRMATSGYVTVKSKIKIGVP